MRRRVEKINLEKRRCSHERRGEKKEIKKREDKKRT